MDTVPNDGADEEEVMIDIPRADEANKAQEIDTIVKADREAFEAWISDPRNSMHLDMPVSALRYLLIPQRVLELSDRPSEVDILLLEQTAQKIEAFVLEHKAEPITDMKLLEAFLEEEKKRETDAREQAGNDGQPFVFVPSEPPDGIDLYHLAHPELVENGRLQLSDHVTNHISISTADNRRMIVGKYLDRKSLHKQGVGKSFYSRLHNSARELGFRFIQGGNNVKNLWFFTTVLGRATLDQIRPERRALFNPTPPEDREIVDTIDFLYPEDATDFVT